MTLNPKQLVRIAQMCKVLEYQRDEGVYFGSVEVVGEDGSRLGHLVDPEREGIYSFIPHS